MKREILSVLIVIVLVAVSVFLVQAEPGSGFGLEWWTVDGGGGQSSGGRFNLSATVGQADAGYTLQGNGYSLAGGYWAAGSAPPHALYMPVVLD